MVSRPDSPISNLFRSLYTALCLAFPAAGLAIDYGDVSLSMPGQTQSFTFLDYSFSNAASNATGNHDFVARLYVPQNYDPSKSYGVVVMMHGDGEAGNDPDAVKNLTQVVSGTNHAQVLTNIRNLTLNAATHDYLLLVPQSPGTYWSREHMFMVKGLVAKASQEYNVDTNRIHMTGLSKGGQGVLTSMMDDTALYATYSPLTSVNYTGFVAAKSVGVPVWLFSGRQDDMLGTSQALARQMIEAQGGTAPPWPPKSDTVNDLYFEHGTIRYTEYANGGHSNAVWNSGAYADQDYYEWMDTHQSSVEKLEAGKTIAVSFNNTDAAGDNYAVRDSANELWNSVDKTGMERTLDISVGFAQTSDGAQTETHIAVTRAFAGKGTVGAMEITAFGEDDAWLGTDYWRTNTGSYGKITFYNLTPFAEYNLKLFASINLAGYLGLYSAGGVSSLFDASFNTDEFLFLNGAFADMNGELSLSVTPQGSANRAVLNAFELTAVPEPSSLALIALAGALCFANRGCRLAVV